MRPADQIENLEALNAELLEALKDILLMSAEVAVRRMAADAIAKAEGRE
jgi:hypothetical protein